MKRVIRWLDARQRRIATDYARKHRAPVLKSAAATTIRKQEQP